MPYFLFEKSLEIGREYTITGEEAHHIAQVRRARVGEYIILQGSDELRFRACVLSVSRHSLTVKVAEKIEVPPEPTFSITLYQALTSEQPLDYILQKSTELGVSRVVLFHSAYSPYRFEGDRLRKKIERWGKILQEAAKQSERVRPPELAWQNDFEGVLAQVREEHICVLDETGAETFNTLAKKQKNISSLSLLVGPEGGFSKEELIELRALRNATIIKMGPRVLRAETAVTAAVAIAQALFGDFQ
ncbi:MAG: 16S rRNA (uracil(1498)-N(3))-methyltransferase [bacterium]|nr:16S rRNA (uracil(1498)-N(3))-methyltransferase [bacterium]